MGIARHQFGISALVVSQNRGKPLVRWRCETSAIFLSCRNAAYGHLPLLRTDGLKESIRKGNSAIDQNGPVSLRSQPAYFSVVINVKRKVSEKASFSLNDTSSRRALTFGKRIATRADLLRE